MTHIAYLSPLPPAASGIADYSARLLRHLCLRHEVEAFTENAAASRDLVPDCPVHELAELDRRRAAGFDLLVHQIGNHAGFHGAIFERAMELPGLVVLHEVTVHDLVRDTALAARDGIAAYTDALRYCLGDTGRLLAHRFITSGTRPDPYLYPLFEQLVDRSLAVVVHSAWARRRIRASRPEAAVTTVPHLVLAAPATDRSAARRTFGLADEVPVIGVFGIPAASKQIGVVRAAFERLRTRHADARLLIAGGEAVAPEPRSSAAVLELGRLDAAGFESAMAACDLACNLRLPTAGEASGSCMRLLELAVPTVVSEEGWFAEIPEGAVVHLERRHHEPEPLARLLAALLARPDLRHRIGAAGRRWALDAGDPQRVLAAYHAAIGLAGARPAPPPPAPPLAAHDPADAHIALVVAGTRALAEIGAEDEAAQRELAHAVLELGI